MSTDKELLKEIDDVKKLIKESEKVIKDKKHNKLWEYAAFAAGVVYLPTVMGTFGGILLTSMVIEDVSLSVSQKRAKTKLQGYYNELAVKQNMLIDEQQKIIFVLSDKNDLLQKDKDELNQRLNILSDIIKRIQEVQENKKI